MPSPMPSPSLREISRERNGSHSSQRQLVTFSETSTMVSRASDEITSSNLSTVDIPETALENGDGENPYSAINENHRPPASPPRNYSTSLPLKEPLARIQHLKHDRVKALSLQSNGSSSGSSTINKQRNNVNQTSYRVLGVVIAISLTYFLSYAPHFGVMFYLFTHDMTVFAASAQNLAFELLMRSFFLNNILDPMIYGLLSMEFRKELRLTFYEFMSVFKSN